MIRIKRFIDFLSDDRGLSTSLLLLFVSLFLGPFLESHLLLRLLSALFFTLLLISGSLSITSNLLSRIIVALIALAAISLRWVDKLVENQIVTLWSAVASLLFLVLLTGVLVVRVFRNDGQVTASRVQGAVAVYILFGLIWSMIYQVCDLSVAGAFNMPATHLSNPATRQEDFTYFSFITLTTLGYGDITPVYPAARMFVVMEGLVGQLYPATLLARLVSLQLMTHGDG